ncbi:unnamed protein product [Aureobasidium uvarum]|uniref:CHY-type domain-containing protein n=1 Tax=Aureobasidium uvarum TaxID=2773716 RepID=A0A9N8KHN4_9PEZI|nr:unnamed protein product [Aureobasidium uvarum]
MCKHILNAQVSIRSPCCKSLRASPPPPPLTLYPPTGRKWFDCAECHAESESHDLKPTLEMVFACKKCKKAFRKDVQEFEESDEYCPHCDNHFVLEAKTPQARLQVESEDVRVVSGFVKDEREREEEQQTIWNLKEASERLG